MITPASSQAFADCRVALRMHRSTGAARTVVPTRSKDRGPADTAPACRLCAEPRLWLPVPSWDRRQCAPVRLPTVSFW